MEIPWHRKVTHTHINKSPKIKPNQKPKEKKNQTKEKKNPHENKISNNIHKIPILSNGSDHCLASLSTFPYWYLCLSYPIATKMLHLPLSLPPEHHLSLQCVFGVKAEGSEVRYNPLSKTHPSSISPTALCLYPQSRGSTPYPQGKRGSSTLHSSPVTQVH